MDKKGVSSIATAILLAPLIGAAGVAVDAAALAAGRRLNEPTRDAEARAVFAGHFTANGGNLTWLGATIGQVTLQADGNDASRITARATATIGVTLYRVISTAPVTRTVTATAQRAGIGLELAVVLDQTASMRQAATGGGTKLDAARSAIHTMLDTLYAGRDTQQNLFVSLVPFARTINIGTGNGAFLDTANMPAGWNLPNWSGCVEARANGHDTTDAAPTGAARFRPYYWPSTYRQVGTVAGGRCTSDNAYPPDSSGNRFCHGDNDAPIGNAAPTQTQINANAMYISLRNAGMTHAQSVGPNILCAQTPIQPLTASRASVNAALATVTAPVRSGGTTTATGLQGAWYTLSPGWRGFWQNPNAALPNMPSLPMPYNTPNMRKVVVMLTDGDNNWQAPYGAACGSTSDSVCAHASATELMYNAYGRVATHNARFTSARINPVNQTNADLRMDERFTAVCNAMKAAPNNITVYVIGFEVASAHRTLLQNCATSPQHYFESPSAAELQTVFRQVGNQLASVRLVN